MTWSLQRHRAEQQQAELGLQCSQKVKDRDTEEPLSQCSKREVETVSGLSVPTCRGEGCLQGRTGGPPASHVAKQPHWLRESEGILVWAR